MMDSLFDDSELRTLLCTEPPLQRDEPDAAPVEPTDYAFYNDAIASGLLADRDSGHLFIFPDVLYAECAERLDVLLWRHFCDDPFPLSGGPLCTRSSMQYLVDAAAERIGPASRLGTVVRGGVHVHVLDGVLPALRPDFASFAAQVRTCLLGGERMELRVHGGVPRDPTAPLRLVCTLLPADGDPRAASEQAVEWEGDGTALAVRLPNGARAASYTPQLSLDTADGRRLIRARRWAFDVQVYPNPLCARPPRVLDINPHRGAKDARLWVLGAGFDASSRVFVGHAPALVTDVPSDALLLCVVPDGVGACSVRVVNGGTVYATCPSRFEYVDE